MHRSRAYDAVTRRRLPDSAGRAGQVPHAGRLSFSGGLFTTANNNKHTTPNVLRSNINNVNKQEPPRHSSRIAFVSSAQKGGEALRDLSQTKKARKEPDEHTKTNKKDRTRKKQS
ncbi:hypothetical protein Dda_4826 [Drechslerella dactyloides]|uniref:Uncharacterized protein n=1 Tax=Drechslerella dactyloides TaxID=74499 RepID=A0AAD6IXM3_DREDA|nr:hypothetical protein Dda_4826 [Drechslerella dactyloides]